MAAVNTRFACFFFCHLLLFITVLRNAPATTDVLDMGLLTLRLFLGFFWQAADAKKNFFFSVQMTRGGRPPSSSTVSPSPGRPHHQGPITPSSTPSKGKGAATAAAKDVGSPATGRPATLFRTGTPPAGT